MIWDIFFRESDVRARECKLSGHLFSDKRNPFHFSAGMKPPANTGEVGLASDCDINVTPNQAVSLPLVQSRSAAKDGV